MLIYDIIAGEKPPVTQHPLTYLTATLCPTSQNYKHGWEALLYRNMLQSQQLKASNCLLSLHA